MTNLKFRSLTTLFAASLFVASCTSLSQSPPSSDTSATVAPMQMTQESCKAMMMKMHQKMKDEGMDMASMKQKMNSGDGMSEQQKECHKMMHENMHDKMKHEMQDGTEAESKPKHQH
ncbi:MAG: hypothetical protein COA47_01820 [Robiginitomaculum sp.]|nr:MAG: hypothetical protein COA47_01820 [Robiginitomaculum sp.]